MKKYFLTVFSKSGEKLLDESFTANHDNEAKEIGKNRLKEAGYEQYTHRCVTNNARLILFQR